MLKAQQIVTDAIKNKTFAPEKGSALIVNKSTTILLIDDWA